MSKIKVIIEMEINIKELKEMKSSQNGYKALTEEEYLDGMNFKYGDGEITLSNEVEQYYNTYEGDSKCIKDAYVVSIEAIK